MLHECEVFPFSACESIFLSHLSTSLFSKANWGNEKTPSSQFMKHIYPARSSTWIPLHQRFSFWKSGVYRIYLGQRKVWATLLPWQNGPFHFTSEWSWFQEERLHCLLPISYIVLNKPKIIWQKELSIWRSDSWKCWNTHLAQEPQISHNQ